MASISGPDSMEGRKKVVHTDAGDPQNWSIVQEGSWLCSEKNSRVAGLSGSCL